MVLSLDRTLLDLARSTLARYGQENRFGHSEKLPDGALTCRTFSLVVVNPESSASFRIARYSEAEDSGRVDHLPAQVRLSVQTDYYPRRQEVVRDLATL
jgi:hypothetical protein